jgi:hypothetical protein
VIEFEDFLFGRDRVALDRIGEGPARPPTRRLLLLPRPHRQPPRDRPLIPWSHSGDDGLDNLVAACHKCNNRKRATLPGPDHLDALLDRNRAWTADLAAIADERRWPRDYQRSVRIARTAYLQSPDERPLWIRTPAGDHYERLGEHRQRLNSLLPAPSG